MKLSKADRSWVRALRGKDIHNGALVAIDYRRGDVLAYVGSAGYYRDDLAGPKFAPQHDAAAAYRQPGSAFKAIVYADSVRRARPDAGQPPARHLDRLRRRLGAQ